MESNVLLAVAVQGHVHHRSAARWLAVTTDPVATCPITQGALVRLLMRDGLEGTEAAQVLREFTGHPRHTFWPDAVGYSSVDFSLVFGNGQVTDAYLVALARHRRARLATFDRDLAKGAEDGATLIPVG